LRYVILGPISVHTDAGPISLERPQRRAVLAVLVLNANQVVSVDRLIEGLWGGAPPATARAQLQALIAAVRRTLRDAGAGDAIATRAGGYVLTVQDGQSDLREFETLMQRARTCVVPADAARFLRDALDLWTGTALDGISAEFVEPARARLAECRLSAHEQLIDIELSLGRHHDLVAELTALVSAHPLRERLVGQLMVALYRSGRQSEALQAGRGLRRRLAEEEGLDPGPRLAQLETAILRADPALTGPAATPPPVAPAGPAPGGRVTHRLPPSIDPIGREEELAALDAVAGTDRSTPVAAALIGPPATGKTAVAVHWAQTRADRFPDGQVLVDGTQSAAEAAAEVLRAFGVAADDLPVDDRDLVTACRETLGGRRALVIVDDATVPGTVRALLPTQGSSMILATATGSLDEATLVCVRPLGTDAAVRLLDRVAGRQRVGTAGRTLVLQYAGEPLAVLLAGAALADHPGRTVEQQMELGSVHAAADPVAAAYAAAFADLDPDERRLVRLVARTPGRDVSVRTVAALAEVPADAGRDVLNRLTRLHLMTRTAEGRFALPGRLRSLAADGQPTDDECAAQNRVIAAHLATADQAARLLYPHLTRLPMPGGDATENPFETPADALRWLDAERVNLVPTIEYAAAHGPRAAAWLLADTLRGYFSLTMRVSDWRRSAQAALTAARTEGSDEARSSAHLSLAELHLRSSRHPAALRDAWQAIAANGRAPLPEPVTTGAPAGAPRRPRTARLLLSLLGVLTL
jgi:DNA-binding SARP family transcriptional activator